MQKGELDLCITKQKVKGVMKQKRGIYEKFFKRFFDFILSFLAIIILSPILILTYLLSLIFIGFSPILRQYRPGKNGKIFVLYKFRSMTNKKDKDGNLLPDKDRITWWGKILRKTSIDELPQLFNILKGDMSIVGPRPRLVKDMVFYSDDVIKKAYSVRPGLTSPSQISGGRSESSWEQIFEADEKYSQNIKLSTDIKIIFKTVFAVFKSDSATSGAGDTKREYYYSDYLLKTNQITQEQYDKGLKKSNEIISQKHKGQVTFDESLHQDQQIGGEENANK